MKHCFFIAYPTSRALLSGFLQRGKQVGNGLMALEQERDPRGVGVGTFIAVGCIHGFIERLMRLEQVGGHSERVIQISQ